MYDIMALFFTIIIVFGLLGLVANRYDARNR